MEMNTIEDWEKWVELAREDPEKFEEERAKTIEAFILSQPEHRQHRCRQLQWKVDAVRKTSPNPLYACIKIHDMLMDSVYGPKGLIEAVNMLKNISGVGEKTDNSNRKAARIVAFRERKTME